MIFSIVITNIVASNARAEQSKNNIDSINKLLSENNVIKGQFYTNDDQSDGLVLDEENLQIVIIKKLNNEYTLNKLPFSSLIESELKEDGISIIKTSRGSSIGGALIGGVIAGGVGAIVGGLSGTKSSQDEVRKIQLNLTVDDLSYPIHTIDFMRLTENHIKKDNPYFIERFNKATHWHKLLSVIINRQSNNQSASNH